MAVVRSSLHQYFHAECARCGFAVDGEIRNGLGGWKDHPWDDFSKQCNYKTAAGRQTLACPHLRAAKVNCQPIAVCGEPQYADGDMRHLGATHSKASPAHHESRTTADEAPQRAA